MSDKQMKATVQNLKDAGCGPVLIEDFMKLNKQGEIKSQLILLSKQRKFLLDNVHENQKKLDCLDYLIFNIKSSNN